MKNRMICRWVILLLIPLMVMSMCLVTPVSAVDNTTVKISPASKQVAKSETFTVEVVVDPKTAIAGVQFDLSFDKTLLTLNNVTEGTLLSQNGANTYFAKMNTVANANTTGTIQVTGVILGENETVSFMGTFAVVQFTAKTVDGISTLVLSNVKVGDASANPVPKDVSGGSVTIGTPPPPPGAPGDATGSGGIDVTDLTKVERIIGGLDAQTPGADVNQDGSINALDITQVERMLAELALSVWSTAFVGGATIPVKYAYAACGGTNTSPPIVWSNVPAGTQSFALICEDPDAPGGIFTHWVMFNIPAGAWQSAEGAPPTGAIQGTNDFAEIGYGGPCPPPGSPHHYRFLVYALDQTLSLGSTTTRAQLLTAMQGHILADGQAVGIYQR